jgi:hypothetical protein
MHFFPNCMSLEENENIFLTLLFGYTTKDLDVNMYSLTNTTHQPFQKSDITLHCLIFNLFSEYFHRGASRFKSKCYTDKIVVPSTLQSKLPEWYLGMTCTEEIINQNFF